MVNRHACGIQGSFYDKKVIKGRRACQEPKCGHAYVTSPAAASAIFLRRNGHRDGRHWHSVGGVNAEVAVQDEHRAVERGSCGRNGTTGAARVGRVFCSLLTKFISVDLVILHIQPELLCISEASWHADDVSAC